MIKEEINARLKQTNVFDIQLIKLSVFFFTLFIASYISKEILTDYRLIWIIGFLICAIQPFWKFWLNCGGSCKKNGKK
jgi:hypothetical protein